MDENMILLSDILEKCLDFRQKPAEETYKGIEAMIAKIDVRERLTLAEKGLAVMNVLNTIKDNSNALECAFELESGLFFKGTLSYTLNLKIDIPASLMNIETYDLLITFGLEDHILGFCGVDHARMRKMLDDAVNFSNIFKLVDSTKLISGENIAELQATLQGLKEMLTLDRIRELKGVMVETEPAWTELKKTIGEEVTFAVNAKDAEDFGKALEEKEPEKKETPENETTDEPETVAGNESETAQEEPKEETDDGKSDTEPPTGE